jgi:hypothetical protein
MGNISRAPRTLPGGPNRAGRGRPCETHTLRSRLPAASHEPPRPPSHHGAVGPFRRRLVRLYIPLVIIHTKYTTRRLSNSTTHGRVRLPEVLWVVRPRRGPPVGSREVVVELKPLVGGGFPDPAVVEQGAVPEGHLTAS